MTATSTWESLYSTQGAVAVLNLQRCIVFASSAMKALFDYTHEGFGSATIESLLLTKEGAHPPTIKWQPSQIIEHLGCCKDGRVFPVELTINPITQQGADWLVVFVRPLTGSASIAPSMPCIQASPNLPLDPRRGRVLIVDDDVMVCSSLRRLLSSLGQDVVVMHSAEDALQSFQAGMRYDLILSDVEMDEMTGVAFVIEAERLFPQLRGRFVLMTGGLFSSHTLKELSQTKIPILEKPFDRKQIEQLLAQFVY
jgi:CheY-like chemotaxis protein